MELATGTGETGHGKQSYILFAVVSLVALAVRTVYLLMASDLAPWLSPGMDAEIYRNWADAILHEAPPEGAFFRAPLYPQVIALLGHLFGGDTFWPIRFLQVLFSSFSAGILALLARRWFGWAAGWTTGLLWALYGMSIYFDGEGLITSLFVSGFIFLIALLEWDRIRQSWITLLPPALLLGLLTGLRANALLWWPLLMLAQWWFRRNDDNLRKMRSFIPLLQFLLMLLIVLPILLHNVQHGGGLSISTQGGINLYLGNHPGASGAYAVDPVYGADWTRSEVKMRAEQIEGAELNDADVSAFYTLKAFEFWRDHPGDALRLTGKKLLLLLNAREINNNRALHPLLREVHPFFAFLVIIGFPLLLITGLPSLFWAWDHAPGIRPVLTFAGIYTLSLLAFFITARYRFPVAPALTLLSGASVQRLWTLRRGPVKVPSLVRGLLAASLLIIVSIGLNPMGEVPEERQWELHVAHAEMRLGDVKKAEGLFRDILDTRYHPTAALNLGVCLLRQDRNDEAYDVFRELTRKDPKNTQAWNNLGVAAELQGKREMAETCYRAALRLNPDFEDARINLIRILKQKRVTLP
ncbi:tetratricopeptide repeat protein [bacterium]|nr:tetratricopeptide repeat protein [bacterium]